MMLCHPKSFEARDMGFRAISGVGFPSIAGKLLRKRNHHPVTRYFCHNGGSRDRKAAPVSFHQRFRRTGQSLWGFIPDNQCKLCRSGEPFNSAPHSQHGGLQDVDPVDFFHTDVKNRDIRLRHDLIEQNITPLCRQFFRIIQSVRYTHRIEHYGTGGNRSGPRAASHFVNTCDAGESMFAAEFGFYACINHSL